MERREEEGERGRKRGRDGGKGERGWTRGREKGREGGREEEGRKEPVHMVQTKTSTDRTMCGYRMHTYTEIIGHMYSNYPPITLAMMCIVCSMSQLRRRWLAAGRSSTTSFRT